MDERVEEGGEGRKQEEFKSDAFAMHIQRGHKVTEARR